MILNNIIDHMKLWCINKADYYQKKFEESGGIEYVGCQMACELEFKLSTLIDKSFENIEDLRKDILNFIDIHYEPSLIKPQNRLAEYIIRKVNQEFREFFEELILKEENLTLVQIPYNRVIVDSEADVLQEKFYSVWKYEKTSYWFPLVGDEPKAVSEKFFVMWKYLKPYMNRLGAILGLPHTHIYSYGECDFRPQHCVETVEIIEYGGIEMFYTDKDFSWAIYFSHEDTVAFAGSIVPKIKALLVNEKEHWDKFEWDWK